MWTAGGWRVKSWWLGEHTGPGLGVSTNKVPLANLPAHWHTEHGNENQFTPASWEQKKKKKEKHGLSTSNASINSIQFIFIAMSTLSGEMTPALTVHLAQNKAIPSWKIKIQTRPMDWTTTENHPFSTFQNYRHYFCGFGKCSICQNHRKTFPVGWALPHSLSSTFSSITNWNVNKLLV